MNYRRVTDKTGIIDFGYAGVPYYKLNNRQIVLFDSGMEILPEIFDALDEMGISVRAVIHTHLHRDHLVNNPIIYERYHSAFYANVNEIEFARESFLAGEDPNYIGFDQTLYTAIDETWKSIVIDDAEFKVIPTPGHSIGHTSFVTPDNIFIAGDSFVSQKVLNYSKIPFMLDIEKGIASMLMISETDHPYYIPAHKWAVKKDELKELIFHNIAIEGHLSVLTAELVKHPMTLFELQKALFEKLHITHLKDTEWVRYMVTSHIKKDIRRKMIIEENGLIRPGDHKPE